jgi:predicted permease
VEHFVRDFQLSIRALVRRPALSIVAVLTFALGIGANSAIYSFVDGVLLTPLPFPEPDRLVRLESLRGGEPGRVSMIDIRDFREDTDLFVDIAAFNEGAAYNFSDGAVPEELPATLTTRNLFDVLGAPLLMGDVWPESYDRERSFGIVLNHGVWRRAFGDDRTILGRKLTLDGAPNYVVFGVLPPGFDFPARADLYRSIAINEKSPNYLERGARNVRALGRLRPGVTYGEAQRVLDNLGREWQRAYPLDNQGITFRLVPLEESYVGEARPYLMLLLGAVGFVLLIAIANVANLLLTRAVGREREVALRTALGGGRLRLLAQLAMEGTVLALAGGALGLVLSHWGVTALTALVRTDLPSWVTVEVNGSVIAFTAVLSFATGLLASLGPALRAGKTHLVETLKESGRGGTGGLGHRRLRGALVVSELALALALLAGAGLLVKSFLRMQSDGLGFDPRWMLTFRVALPWSTYPNDSGRIERFQTETRRRLLEIPGADAVSFNGGLPIIASEEGYRRSFTVEGQPEVEQRDNPYAFHQEIHPSYFEVLGIPVLEGRGFTELDLKTTEPVAILNRHFAETLWPGESALGKRLKLGDPNDPSPFRTVVGIVGDVKHESLVGDKAFDLYTNYLQTPYANAYFLLRTRVDPLSLAEPARRAVLAVDPDQSIYDIMTMEERLFASVWQRRLASVVFALFAALALFLAAVGIYGVMSYAVSQRQKEMGIRSALGASPGDILALVLRDALVLSLTGCAVGIAGALLLARALSSLLHQVSPGDPATFASVAATLVAVALGASLVPAIRARGANPVSALRHE